MSKHTTRHGWDIYYGDKGADAVKAGVRMSGFQSLDDICTVIDLREEYTKQWIKDRIEINDRLALCKQKRDRANR